MPEDLLRALNKVAERTANLSAEILAERDRWVDGHQVGERIREVMAECGPDDFEHLASRLTVLFRDLWLSAMTQLGPARHAREDETEVMEAVQ